jgi:hypothetical protein
MFGADVPRATKASAAEHRRNAPPGLYALLLEIRDGITQSNQFLDFIARILGIELSPDQTTGAPPAPEG